RSSNRIRAGQSPHFFIRNVQSQGSQVFDDLRIAAMSTLAQGSQPLNQFRILPANAIAKNMKFAIADTGADFHAGNDLNPQVSPYSWACGNPGHNVVVRDGQRCNSCLVGEPQHFSWRKASIGVGRMQMEVDATHVTSCNSLPEPACWAMSC